MSGDELSSLWPGEQIAFASAFSKWPYRRSKNWRGDDGRTPPVATVVLLFVISLFDCILNLSWFALYTHLVFQTSKKHFFSLFQQNFRLLLWSLLYWLIRYWHHRFVFTKCNAHEFDRIHRSTINEYTYFSELPEEATCCHKCSQRTDHKTAKAIIQRQAHRTRT